MKKVTKSIALVLSLLLSVGLFAACDGSKEQNVQTGDAFTYWCTPASSTLQTLTSYSELLMY